MHSTPHTALTGTFLVLLVTTLTLAMASSPSIAKTICVFLVVLAATIAAAGYVNNVEGEKEEENEHEHEAIQHNIKRGVGDESKLVCADKDAPRPKDEAAVRIRREMGEERIKNAEQKKRRRAEDRKEEERVRGLLRERFWPTRSELLGARKERWEVVEEEV